MELFIKTRNTVGITTQNSLFKIRIPYLNTKFRIQTRNIIFPYSNAKLRIETRNAMFDHYCII